MAVLPAVLVVGRRERRRVHDQVGGRRAAEEAQQASAANAVITRPKVLSEGKVAFQPALEISFSTASLVTLGPLDSAGALLAVDGPLATSGGQVSARMYRPYLHNSVQSLLMPRLLEGVSAYRTDFSGSQSFFSHRRDDGIGQPSQPMTR